MIDPQIKELAPQIWKEIEKAKHILLHLHVNPDGDSVGSALGLYHALISIGKKVTVIRGDSSVSEAFKKVPGINQIVPKNFFEVDLSEFDLFIVLDSGALNRISKIKEVVFPPHLRVVAIDHHSSNPGYGQLNLILPHYSSVSEMLYDLLGEWKVEIDPEAATCLFLGMYTDTGGFRYAATTGNTMRAAADLRDRSQLITSVLAELDNNLSAAELKLDALAFSKSETVGKLAMTLVSYQDLQTAGIADVYIETGHIAHKLKAVVGYEVGICAIESKPNEIKLSARKRDGTPYDLSVIMSRLGGGGGHAVAAGATVTATVAEARERVIATVRELYPDLLN
jgi:phosphoesterase RecJ-like protein